MYILTLLNPRWVATWVSPLESPSLTSELLPSNWSGCGELSGKRGQCLDIEWNLNLSYLSFKRCSSSDKPTFCNVVFASKQWKLCFVWFSVDVHLHDDKGNDRRLVSLMDHDGSWCKLWIYSWLQIKKIGTSFKWERANLCLKGQPMSSLLMDWSKCQCVKNHLIRISF